MSNVLEKLIENHRKIRKVERQYNDLLNEQMKLLKELMERDEKVKL